MTASTVEVTVPATQPAEPSEIVSEHISTAPNSTALALSEPKLAKIFASAEEAAEAAERFGYNKLGVAATKKEFQTLDAELNNREGSIAAAIVTLQEAAPYIAKMQALLSQRGKDRKKVLRAAKLPGWTKWAKAYAQKLNCTFRTLQNHIKGQRERKKGNHPTPPTHYTKVQTDEMVSTCNLAIEAKKAWEAGRPVGDILANIKMDGKRLLAINEAAQELPDYRKCTELLLSVIEKYAKGEVPVAKIVEEAKDVRKEVTRKQADASLTEAAKAGKQQPTAAPVVGDAEPEQAKGAAPAKKPTSLGSNKPAVQVTAKPSPAAKGSTAPKAQPKGTSTSKRSTAAVASTPANEAGAPEKPKANGSTVVYEAFPGGPKVLEVVVVAEESSSDQPKVKHILCAGMETNPYPTLDEAKAACDQIAERLVQEQRTKEAERQAAAGAVSSEQQVGM